jgi:hypothetical protein
MQINKKAEGTASTFLISSLIAISILTIIGLFVNGFSTLYSQTEIEYFNNYDDIFENVSQISNDYVGDYDLNQNETNTEITRTEDNLFFKAFEIVRKIPKLTGSVATGLNRIGVDLGIPTPFIILLVAILGIVIITLVVKIIRGFNNV